MKQSHSSYALQNKTSKIKFLFLCFAVFTCVHHLSVNAATLYWSGSENSDWDYSSQNWFDGVNTASFSESDSAVFDDTLPLGTYDIAIQSSGVTIGSMTVNSGNTYVFSGGTITAMDDVNSGTIGQLSLLGNGTTILATDVIFSSGIRIISGTLQVGNGGSIGHINTDTSSIYLLNPATLVFHRNDNANVGDIVIANTLEGTGTMVFRGTNTINQSSYKFTGDNVGFSGSITIENGARLILEGASTEADNSITVEAGSSVYLAANHAYYNPIFIAGNGWSEAQGQLGALRLGDGANLMGTLTLTDNARITAINDHTTISGNIDDGENGFQLEKTGNGTLTLTGASSFTGGITLNEGTLKLSANASLASGCNLSIENSAIFDISSLNANGIAIANLNGTSNTTNINISGKILTISSGNYAGSITGNNGNLEKTGTGILILSGSNSYTGTTTLNDGTLEISTTGTLTTGSMSVESGTFIVNGIVNGESNIAGTIKGTGTINGNATVSGVLSPGNSIGMIHFGDDLLLDATAIVHLEIDHNSLTNDYFKADGTLTITAGALLQIDPAELAKYSTADVIYIFEAGSVIGNFGNVTDSLDRIWTSGFDGTYGFLYTIPEPSSYGTFIGAMGFMAAFASRRKR